MYMYMYMLKAAYIINAIGEPRRLKVKPQPPPPYQYGSGSGRNRLIQPDRPDRFAGDPEARALALYPFAAVRQHGVIQLKMVRLTRR